MHALQGSRMLNNGGMQLRATVKTTPNNGYPQQENRANTTLQSRKTFIKKASDKIQSLLDASSIQNFRGITISHNKLTQLAEQLYRSSEPQAPLQQTLNQILQRLNKIKNNHTPTLQANCTQASVAALLQQREPPPLKTTTRYTITIQPNTEKAERLRGQSETKVLTEIHKEVHNTIAVHHLKSRDIKVTLKDQQAKEQAIRAGDRLRKSISIKILYKDHPVKVLAVPISLRVKTERQADNTATIWEIVKQTKRLIPGLKITQI